MTWEIRITQKIKDDIVVVDRKNEFEHLLQITPARAKVTISPSHLDLSAFHC